jgi:acyl-CoA reductase-like NAD-dependent aldehyde dehydrogenase
VNLPPENKAGFFYPPTVITNLEDSSRCLREEIFGPVVCVVPFDTEQEVLRRANDCDFGLCATVWTKSLDRAHRVAHGLKVGTVWVNTWLLRNLHMPFGGKKLSGIGREGTFDSREFYTEKKSICLKIDPVTA